MKEKEGLLNPKFIVLIIVGVLFLGALVTGFIFRDKVFSWLPGKSGILVGKASCRDLGGGRTTVPCDALLSDPGIEYEDISTKASDVSSEEGLYCCRRE